MWNKIKNSIINLLISLIAIFIFLLLIDKAIPLLGMKPVMKSFPFVNGGDRAVNNSPLVKDYNSKYSTGEYSITIKTNSLGFRSRECSIEKPGSTFRIFVLGDSFAFGQGVENYETFSILCEDRLNGLARGSKYEVINTGYPGGSPCTETGFFRNYGIRFDPDVVILAFFVGNDIIEDIGYAKPMSKADFLALTSNYITARRWRAGAIGALRKAFEACFPNLYEFLTVKAVKLKYKFGGHRTTFDYMLLKNYPKDIKEGWDISLNAVNELNDICAKRNIRLFVLIVPFQEQFLAKLDKKKYQQNKPQEVLSKFCSDNKILYLDLYPAFKDRSKDGSYYYLKDGHWTPRGHRVVADEIMKFLIKNKLLEKT